jgi:hypothetical protein
MHERKGLAVEVTQKVPCYEIPKTKSCVSDGNLILFDGILFRKHSWLDGDLYIGSGRDVSLCRDR